MSTIAVKKVRENAILPTYGSKDAAGADLYACLDHTVTIEAGETMFIRLPFLLVLALSDFL